MNLKDITPYIIEKISQPFQRKLSQDDPIVQELLKLNADWNEAEKYLTQFGGKYILYRFQTTNGIAKEYDIYEVNYSGTWCAFKYQWFTLSGYFTLDGEANKVLLVDRLWECISNYEVKNIETLDTIYQEIVKEAKTSKRELMNYYNKLIKEIKQEYRKALERHNNLLGKGGRKNDCR